MLLELAVADFAIIERLRLSFAPGFNVLTGETGAGKSILIDAVSMLLGGRGGPEAIRAGASLARIEGIFALPHEADPLEDGEASLGLLLEEYGATGDPGTVILSREIQHSGRTVARVNGRAVPVGALQQIGRALVDIHGQGDHLSLLHAVQQLRFLDRFAGLLEQRRLLAEGVAALRHVRKEIAALLQDESALARRLDLLNFQITEIEAALLRPDEEEALGAERALLANAEQLAAGSTATYEALSGGARDDKGALDLIGQAIVQLGGLARLDPSLAEPLRVLEEASYQLDDVSATLRHYRDSVEFNPARLEEIEERLALITRLKRKYGVSIEDILRFAEAAAAEREGIDHGEERLADLRQREGALLANLGAQAEALSHARREAANALAAAVEGELGDLSMGGTRFEVAFERAESADGLPFADGQRWAFDPTGVDRVEFLIAANRGEPLRPLAKTASGGETARLMLALKTILSAADAVPTLIFDEIDVGIGGRSGQVVGAKLCDLSARHQVLCITHLPQIAVYGQRHFLISKAVSGERTATTVRLLNDDERVGEVAAMLGGVSGSATAIENARELLARAQGHRAHSLAEAAPG